MWWRTSNCSPLLIYRPRNWIDFCRAVFTGIPPVADVLPRYLCHLHYHAAVWMTSRHWPCSGQVSLVRDVFTMLSLSAFMSPCLPLLLFSNFAATSLCQFSCVSWLKWQHCICILFCYLHMQQWNALKYARIYKKESARYLSFHHVSDMNNCHLLWNFRG